MDIAENLREIIVNAEAVRRELVNNFTGAGRHKRIEEIDAIHYQAVDLLRKLNH